MHPDAPIAPPIDRRPGAAFRNLPRNLRISVAALIISNLWPLIGVLFLGWDVSMVMFLFWFENVIIGFYYVLKMLSARGKSSEFPGCAVYFFLIPFFIFHYGIFCMVHGMLIGAFFGGQRAEFNSPADLISVIFQKDLIGPAFVLFLSHGVSFIMNYINAGEFKSSTAHGLLGQPYGRIFILHLAILFGGFLAAATGSSRPAVAILVLLKIVVDVAAHVAEHKGRFLLQRLAAGKLQKLAALRAQGKRNSDTGVD